MEQTILQVLAVAGSAVALSFGLARMILRQHERYIDRHAELMARMYERLDKRMERLEIVLTELSQELRSLLMGVRRSAK